MTIMAILLAVGWWLFWWTVVAILWTGGGDCFTVLWTILLFYGPFYYFMNHFGDPNVL